MATSASKLPVLLALGDSALTVQFGEAIEPNIHARVLGLAQKIGQMRDKDALFRPIRDVVPTFRSLTVHFAPLEVDSEQLGQQLLALAQDSGQEVLEGRHWRLPACFDVRMAPDLSALAAAKQMGEDEIIARVLSARLKVYMLGFLPGFPYMGGLPPELAMPRLSTPRQRVAAQSIALAGEMCAVYPWESPGGWNLIGRTPVQLFDLRHSDQPSMLAAGDTVSWYQVEWDEYEALFRKCQAGEHLREAFLAPEGCA